MSFWSVIDQLWGQDGWILAKFFVLVHKNTKQKKKKKEQGQYPATLLWLYLQVKTMLRSHMTGLQPF